MKPKLQITRTVSVFIMYFGLGLHEVVIGPALLDFEILFNSDTKTMGILFVVHSLAYSVGSVLCGFVIDKYNQELLASLAGMLSAISIAGSPWLPNVFAFIFCFGTFKGIFGGFIETAGDTYLVGLWMGTKYQDPLMQFLHFAWSVSATVVPFVLQPFLATRLPMLAIYNDSSSNVWNATENVTQVLTSTPSPVTTNVRYGFLVVGGLIFITSLYPLIVFFIAKPTCKPLPFIKAAEDVKQTEDKKFKIKMLIMTYVYFLFEVGMELTFGGLVATYVVKGLGWEKYQGPLITSIYWGIFGLSRLISVGISAFLRPVTMIFSSYILITVSLLILIFVGHMHEAVVWIATGIFGYAIGPLFPSGVLWASRYILINGPASSVITVGACSGGVIFPALSAYLFSTVSHQWLIYIILGECVIGTVVFIAMHITARRHGELLKTVQITKDVETNMIEKINEETGSVQIQCKDSSGEESDQMLENGPTSL